LMRVVREAGYEVQAKGLRERFSMTIKKKQHSAYGDHFREVDMTLTAKKIVF
jgi:ATP-dependent RNA helicase DBP3